jgi:hypothetical protein
MSNIPSENELLNSEEEEEPIWKLDQAIDIVTDQVANLLDPKILKEIDTYIQKSDIDNILNMLTTLDANYYEIVAIKLIETGELGDVADSVDFFNWLSSKLAIKIIEAGKWRSLEYELSHFNWLNNAVAIKFIEAGELNIVAEDITYFYWLSNAVAIKLIEANRSDVLVEENFTHFEWSFNCEVALAYIKKGQWYTIADDLLYYEWLNHEVALELIKTGKSSIVVRNLEKFEWLNNAVALLLIKTGESSIVVRNLEKFEWIDSIHAYLKYFPNINSNIFRIFNDLYMSNNIDAINNLSRNINEVSNDMILWEAFIWDIEGVVEKDIAELIYSKRDYSPRNIEDYTDESQDLYNYTFNSDGYNFTLSNLLWYKLLDWEELNESLLEEFKQRVAHISTISQNKSTLWETVNEYAQKEWIQLEAKTLESHILEYLLKKESKGKEVSINDFDLLIAYQLMWKYDEFMKSSNDKLACHADKETQHMIQIQALLKEYWDPLKETIKTLENVSLGSEDKQYFDSHLRDVPLEVRDLTKQKTLKSMIRSFSSRPEETITDDIVKKSIDTKLKWVLQTTDITNEEISNFSNEFKSEDSKFWNSEELQQLFIEKWVEKVEEHFWSVDRVWLNIRSIAKIQDSIYQTLQTESNKFEAITDQWGKNKGRKVFARFWKTQYDAYARWVWDVCIGTDSEMWKNKNYFELVLFDQERQKNIGTVMLLNMQEDNGDKYLLFCPNPSVEFDDKVSSQKLFDQISEIVKTFAQENNYNGVLFDPTHWKWTNRSGDFQKALVESQLKDDESQNKTIDLDNEYRLGGEYSYKNNLSYLWEK